VWYTGYMVEISVQPPKRSLLKTFGPRLEKPFSNVLDGDPSAIGTDRVTTLDATVNIPHYTEKPFPDKQIHIQKGVSISPSLMTRIQERTKALFDNMKIKRKGGI
jgi:hypothetical protein